MDLDDYMVENEELRERLGMDPEERLDSRVIRKKKQVKEEQSLALNRVLTKEVKRIISSSLSFSQFLIEGGFSGRAFVFNLGS